jgi:hypothetical protein
MIAGGRTVNLREAQSMIFMAGASAMMVGNYLTTLNQPVEKDLQMLKDLGLDPRLGQPRFQRPGRNRLRLWNRKLRNRDGTGIREVNQAAIFSLPWNRKLAGCIHLAVARGDFLGKTICGWRGWGRSSVGRASRSQ